MPSAAAADVEAISDFIGSEGISSIDWTGISLNKVISFFFPLSVPSAGKFALLEKKKKRITHISFCVLICLQVCVSWWFCIFV